MIMGIPVELFRMAANSPALISAAEPKPDIIPPVVAATTQPKSYTRPESLSETTSGPHQRTSSKMPELDMYGDRGYWAYGAYD